MKMPNEEYATFRINLEVRLMEAIAERQAIRLVHPEWVTSINELSEEIELAKKNLERFLLENL